MAQQQNQLKFNCCPGGSLPLLFVIVGNLDTTFSWSVSQSPRRLPGSYPFQFTLTSSVPFRGNEHWPLVPLDSSVMSHLKDRRQKPASSYLTQTRHGNTVLQVFGR